MRLVTCEFEGQQYLGVELGEKIFFPVRHSEWQEDIDSMLALIDAGPGALEQLKNISGNADEQTLVEKKPSSFMRAYSSTKTECDLFGLKL